MNPKVNHYYFLLLNFKPKLLKIKLSTNPTLNQEEEATLPSDFGRNETGTGSGQQSHIR